MKALFFGLAALVVACSSGGSGGGGFADSGVGGFGGSGAVGTGGVGGVGGAPGCAAGQLLCGAVCASVKDDPLHCGGCDMKCNVGDVCNNGVCQTVTDCSLTPCVGLTYCDLTTKKCLPGCLTDTQCGANEKCDPVAHSCDCAPGNHRCSGACVSDSSLSACGAACTVCAQDPNGQAACNGGQCSLACNAGFHDCGGSCKSSSSPASCGSSCTACPSDPNGTPTCNAGQCGISCNAGSHLCGSQCASNTSPASCGTSCTPCPTKTGATASCVAGACAYACTNGVTLGAAVSYPTSYSPNGVALGDVTGDGKIDAVVSGSNGISVHAGNGDGTFQTAALYTLANATGVAIGDINSDGKKDVIATAGVSNSLAPPRGLWKLTQQGGGTLSSAVQLISTPSVATRAFLEDWNGDGKLDFALFFSSGISYATGNGNGSFNAVSSKSLGGTDVAAAEVTGDGRPDLVIASYDKVYVVPGSAGSVFGTEAFTSITYNSYYQVATGDMNGDGKADVVIGSDDVSAAGVQILNSLGGGSLSAPATQSGGRGNPVVGDFNKDGKPDVAQLDSYYVWLRLSTPGGALSAPAQIYSGASPTRAAAADLDGDGFSDLVIASDATWNDEIIVMRSSCN